MTTSRAPGRQAERDVRNSQYSADEWNRFLDLADTFDGLYGTADVVLIARCAREDERVKYDVFGVDAEFSRKKRVRTFGDLAFTFPRERLGLYGVFVDAADDQRGAVGTGERAYALEFFLSVFKVDRIDDAFPLAVGESQLDAAWIGGVDHDRRFDLADELVRRKVECR